MSLDLSQLCGAKYHPRVELDGARIEYGSDIDVRGNVYSGMTLINCDISGRIVGISCTGAVFSDCSITLSSEDVALLDSNMQHTVFSNCNIKFSGGVESCFFNYASFVNCKISNISAVTCDFVGTRFYNCEIANSSFLHTVFEEAIFDECSFLSCSMRDMAFDYSTFINCTFKSCELSLRQTLYSYSAQYLLSCNGISFVAEQQNPCTGNEIVSVLGEYKDQFREAWEYFPLFNTHIVLNEAIPDDILFEAFQSFALHGQYRRAELLAKLLNNIPNSSVDSKMRSRLLNIITQSIVSTAQSNNSFARSRVLLGFSYIEPIRDALRIRYGEKGPALLSFDAELYPEENENYKELQERIISELEEQGISFEVRRSTNSLLFTSIIPLLSPEQILIFFEILQNLLPSDAVLIFNPILFNIVCSNIDSIQSHISSILDNLIAAGVVMALDKKLSKAYPYNTPLFIVDISPHNKSSLQQHSDELPK